MERHPLVSAAAVAVVVLFACGPTAAAETMSPTRSVAPPPPLTAITVASRALAAESATTRVVSPVPASARTTVTSRRPACPPITPASITAGRKIFTGPGNCHACHGADASGTAMAPTLHAHSWLNIDGSYASIAGLVQRGVAKPKAHSEVMPPMGGANLSASQVCEVAADVFSLSHPAAAPRTAAHLAPSAAPRPLAHAAPAAVGRSAAQQMAAAPASPRAAARAAAASSATSASEARTVSMRWGKMQITFSGTPENYTIHVENSDAGTSSTYSYAGGPVLAGRSTASTAEAAVAAPAVPARQSAAPPAEAAVAAPSAAAPAPVAAATAATPAATTATQAPGCPPIAAPLIAAGRKVFAGEGNCYACHGENAKGTPMAPALGAHAWLNIDGSYASIVELVTSGVPKPKAHSAPMPPKGGSQISGQQVCAVAAYVYSLSH